MILVDSEIKDRIQRENLIQNAELHSLGSIAYDLTIKEFIYQNENGENEKKKYFQLQPNMSVIVSTEEILNMPNDLVGKIIDKNSQIRRGLQIAAPVYQPGHKTRIFIRVTNLSVDVIELSSGQQIASIMFETLSKNPDNTYNGAFVDEYEYKGLSSYKDIFSQKVIEVDNKINDIKSLENKIYGNVMTLMAIFIGIFSLININLDMLTKLEFTKQSIYTFDIMVVGIIGMFVALIGNLLPVKRSLCNKLLCYGLPTILLLVAGFII